MTPIVRDLLAISPEQRKHLDEIQNELDIHLGKLLTPDQKRLLQEPEASRHQSLRWTGQILAAAEQNRLKLSADQKKELTALQKDVDGKLEKILTEEQRKQSKIGFASGGPPPGGAGGPPQPGQILPSFLPGALHLTEEQKKQIDAFQKQTDAKLDQLLTDEQKKQLKNPQNPSRLPQPGQLMSVALQARLKLTADQKKSIQALQKEADALLGKLFTEEQKKQFKEMQANVGRGVPGGPGPRPGGPPGLPNFGPPGGSPLFRVYRFAGNHPGLVGKDLIPGKTVEEMEKSVARSP
jgi:Spy/CpxP family protein refolding chaperone